MYTAMTNKKQCSSRQLSRALTYAYDYAVEMNYDPRRKKEHVTVIHLTTRAVAEVTTAGAVPCPTIPNLSGAEEHELKAIKKWNKQRGFS